MINKAGERLSTIFSRVRRGQSSDERASVKTGVIDRKDPLKTVFIKSILAADYLPNDLVNRRADGG